MANEKKGRLNIIAWNILFVERILSALKLGVVLYAIHNIKDLLGRNCIILTFFAYQTCGSQPYNLTWWISNSPNRIFSFEIVKVCKNPQNLSVVEIIGKGGHSFMFTYFHWEWQYEVRQKIISVRLTILSCVRQRYMIRYVIVFFFSV